MKGRLRHLLPLVALFFMTGTAKSAVFYPTSFTLSNGLQVIVVSNSLAPVVSQMVWYKVGSNDDPPGKSGLAHYLEHLMFRGTANVPPGEFSKVIAAQGGNDNAFTSHDYTAYFEQIAADRLPMIMQMEADRMQNLRIATDTAAPELRVIIDERQQRTDNDPGGRFNEKFGSNFMPGYPYGRPIIGWKRDIEKLSAEDVRKFYNAHYAPNNAIVVISGDVKTEEVMRLAAATYGRVPKKELPQRRAIGPAPQPKTKAFTVKDTRVEQPEISMRIVAPSRATQKETETYAYEVLANALADEEVGVLYHRLVLESSLASEVEIGYDPDVRGENSFRINAVPRPGSSHRKLEHALLKALTELSVKGLDANTIEEAKQRLKRSAIFARESLMSPGYVFGSGLTTGRTVSEIEEWPERIESVNADQVNAALRKLATSDKRTIGALIPDRKPKPEKRNGKRRQAERGAVIR